MNYAYTKIRTLKWWKKLGGKSFIYSFWRSKELGNIFWDFATFPTKREINPYYQTINLKFDFFWIIKLLCKCNSSMNKFVAKSALLFLHFEWSFDKLSVSSYVLKVIKFSEAIFFVFISSKKRTKIFFDFFPKDLKCVKLKNKGLSYIR